MTQENKRIGYRVELLERKMSGVHTQLCIEHAHREKLDRRVRDLEIRLAVQQGVSPKKLAPIYDISVSRAYAIAKKVA